MTEPLPPFEVLYEAEGLPPSELPDELRALYGGLGFVRPRVVAGFVSSVDGVVSLPGVPLAHRVLADGSPADRFVLGLLRACADVVLVGGGTLRGSPRATWAPAEGYPPGARAFAGLRARLGLPERPAVAVLTGGGAIDPAHPALREGALVLTTERGAAALRGPASAGTEVAVLPGGDGVDQRAALDLLRARGRGLVVSEAGPGVTGGLLAAGLVDELFLTLSPLVAGRSREDGRLSLAEGTALLPGVRVAADLVAVRRHGDHLFLRYAFGA